MLTRTRPRRAVPETGEFLPHSLGLLWVKKWCAAVLNQISLLAYRIYLTHLSCVTFIFIYSDRLQQTFKMVCINQILLFFFDCGGTANNSQCRDGLQRSLLTPWDTSLTFARGWWLMVVSACFIAITPSFPSFWSGHTSVCLEQVWRRASSDAGK